MPKYRYIALSHYPNDTSVEGTLVLLLLALDWGNGVQRQQSFLLVEPLALRSIFPSGLYEWLVEILSDVVSEFPSDKPCSLNLFDKYSALSVGPLRATLSETIESDAFSVVPDLIRKDIEDRLGREASFARSPSAVQMVALTPDVVGDLRQANIFLVH